MVCWLRLLGLWFCCGFRILDFSLDFWLLRWVWYLLLHVWVCYVLALLLTVLWFYKVLLYVLCCCF